MPAWALLVLKMLLPLLMQYLVKAGVFTQLQADVVTDLESFVVALKSLKTYSAPSDFPDQNSRGQVSGQLLAPAQNNFNKMMVP